MWFLKSWIYKSRYGSLPFKMRNFTESYQEECREVIKDEFSSITAKLPKIWTRIQLKDAKQKMHDFYTDILGRSIPVKQPIFSEDEVAKTKQNQMAYIFVLFLLVFFESALYSMMAPLFLKKQDLVNLPIIKYLFGFAFALVFVAALHFAFKSIWDFFKAKNLIEKENLPKEMLSPFYKYLFIGLFIVVVFLITNTYTGYIRATIFEGSGKSSTSDMMQKLHIPLLVFSIAITFIVALVMALLEKEIAEKSEKIKVFNNWKRQQKQRKEYNTKVKEMLKKCIDKKDVLIEQYWGVMKDLQRVFEIEVDADRKELYAELNTKIGNNEIDLLSINEFTYQKYLSVAITRHELFEYGIITDKGINETINDLYSKVALIEIFERKNASNGNETEKLEEEKKY
jgi:hypothetical protein